MSKYFTVVFKVNDEAKFKEISSPFIQAMGDEDEINGAEVTAVGWCDAMSESDAFREALEAGGFDSDEILTDAGVKR